jgi:hypothetical protein
MIDLSLSPASSDGSAPAGTEPNPNAWAEASATMTRFRQVYDEVRANCLGYNKTEEIANDTAQVEAWLDMLARKRHLRVTRTTCDDGRIARHFVEFLDENEDGEVVPIECGGYCEMSELCRGYCGGTEWLCEKKEVSKGWFEIEVMITDMFPDHPMFKRADGSDIVLDPYTDDHFHIVKVTIHEEELLGDVAPCNCSNCVRRRSEKH